MNKTIAKLLPKASAAALAYCAEFIGVAAMQDGLISLKVLVNAFVLQFKDAI